MRPKICVALPTSKHLHRQMIEGVVDFANANGPWQLFPVRSGRRRALRVLRRFASRAEDESRLRLSPVCLPPLT